MSEGWAELPDSLGAGHEPRGFIHYRLLIETNRDDPDDIVFTCAKMKVGAKESEAAAWAQDVANSHPVALLRGGGSPYDLPARRPCWIIVELDPTKKGWQFESSRRAVSLKDAAAKAYGLTHYYVHPKEPSVESQGDGCTVVMFGVGDRGRDKCEINLHTEFLQDGKRLKIIIDPDVPTTGDDPP